MLPIFQGLYDPRALFSKGLCLKDCILPSLSVHSGLGFLDPIFQRVYIPQGLYIQDPIFQGLYVPEPYIPSSLYSQCLVLPLIFRA